MQFVRRGAPAGEVAAYGLLTALGAAMLATSFGYGILQEGGEVGPGLLPAVVGTLLLLLAGTELIARLRGSGTPHHAMLADVVAPDEPDEFPVATAAQPADSEVDIFGRSERDRVRQLGIVVVAMLAAILLVPVLGFPLSFGLLTLFISWYVERRPLVTAAVVSAVSIAAVHLLFVEFLSVPLPGGVLGLGG